jgi:hypothetical protein
MTLEQQADAILAASRGVVDAPALARMQAAIEAVLEVRGPLPHLAADARTATRLLREAEDRVRAGRQNG